MQAVTEEIVSRMARHVHRTTGMKNLCLAGGVALNCVANGILHRDGPFDEIWVQPASGDAGGALGAALFVWHQLLEHPRHPGTIDTQQGSRLGPWYRDEEVAAAIAREQLPAHHLDDHALYARVSELLAHEKVVGWFRGRMEFGPRALGSRSIIGDARSTEMQTMMNVKIKFRESFRPFAPSVLKERTAEYFDLDKNAESPYMLLVAAVRDDKRVHENRDGLWGLDLLNQKRSVIPAVTHVDYSARLQTVDKVRSPDYYNLIKRFEQDTGCPVIINTSFNVRGEPIVCTPDDAIRCFLHTDIDALVVENYLILKSDVPADRQVNREQYLNQFKLD